MFARELWKRIETIHAVTYFSSESIDAARDAGLRGFWMGYFGFRAAPMGAVGPGVVEAAFSNFETSMVARSIPDAWTYASPGDLVRRRAAAAARALRRVAPSIESVADAVSPVLEEAVGRCEPNGRPLFAANRDVEPPDDPVERLWQWCTTLREHRGDGHVAALAVERIDGCAAHLMLSADTGVPPAVFLDHRGWSDEQQADSARRLAERGLLDGDGITEAGRQARRRIEDTTDELAAEPFDGFLDRQRRADVLDMLGGAAVEVIAGDALPFPNPMGLPRLDESTLSM